MRALLCGSIVLLSAAWLAVGATAQQQPAGGGDAQGAPIASNGVLEIHFTPVASAQLAIWIERAGGEFLSTLRLTEAVAYRGIGNRPGASEMNSGFRWPYGRREGALPIWAHRRASAPGARLFRRVIFQNRGSEGFASKTATDQSVDDYYCLSFDKSRSSKDALDAVSCASVFNSDKGRFITQADVDAGYAEPYETTDSTHANTMRPLSLTSLYPPRRDVETCDGDGSGCNQHPDAAQFAAHARDVMSDIDAVTMATPVGGVEQQILFNVPAMWSAGEYRACIEVNVEGDYNDTFNDQTLPTPILTGNPNCNGSGGWDYWSMCYGYAYRGQPSVVYCTDFHLGDETEHSFTTDEPIGSAGSWDLEEPSYGTLFPMDGMTDDPVHAPGSGADRVQLSEDGYRVKVVVKPPTMCTQDASPTAVSDLQVLRYPDELHAHEWARLRFRAASDDRGVFRYDVRVSTSPITDAASFTAATPAKEATIQAAELLVPTSAAPGKPIEVDIGALVQLTHYYVGVRAMDACTGTGPIRTAEFTTPKRVFATVSPCFVATAAYGSPMAEDVGVLRRMRDRHMLTNDLGRMLVSTYYAVGPVLADAIRGHDRVRAAVRAVLAPLVELARQLDD